MRFVLLATAMLVALAPLCAVVVGSEVAGATSLHGNHAMDAAEHDAPTAMHTSGTISADHHGEHCAPHSCCFAAFVKTARLKHADGNVVLAVMVDTSAEPQASCTLARVLGPDAPPGAAVARVPLRL